MTFVAISCQGNHAEILVDTAAYSANLRIIQETTKLHVLPHLDAAIASGGLAEFSAWARFAMESDARLSAATFDELVEKLPDVLPPIFRTYVADRGATKCPAVLLVVGYSAAAGQFVAFELGSDDDFTPRPITGTFVHPTPWRLRPSHREYELLLQAYEELGAHPDIVADIRDNWLTMPAPDPKITPSKLVDLALQTREDRSMGGGIPIHGRLMHTTLRQGRHTTRSVWTFPNEGPDFDRFIEGRDHPRAQAMDCWCGSGRNVLDCCRAGDLTKPCRCESGKTFADCCLIPKPSPLSPSERATSAEPGRG